MPFITDLALSVDEAGLLGAGKVEIINNKALLLRLRNPHKVTYPKANS